MLEILPCVFYSVSVCQPCPGRGSIILWFISLWEELMLNEVELSILNLGCQIAPNSALIIFCIQLCIRDGLGKSLKKKQELNVENNQLFVPHLLQRKCWEKAEGNLEWRRINWGCGIQCMRSCQYPERGLTCARCNGSFLLPLLFSHLHFPNSTEELIPFLFCSWRWRWRSWSLESAPQSRVPSSPRRRLTHSGEQSKGKAGRFSSFQWN